MAEERKRITDLPAETDLDDTDLLLLGSNGTSALRNTTLGALKAWMLTMVVPPVGWIEFNESGVNPANRYPGTVWELTGKGAVDVCVDENDPDLKQAGKLVGANTVTLAPVHLPKHTHGIGSHTHDVGNHMHVVPGRTTETYMAGNHAHKGYYKKVAAAGSGVMVYQGKKDGFTESNDDFTAAVSSHKHSIYIPSIDTGSPNGDTLTGTPRGAGSTGENSSGLAVPISVMQKSYTVYRWKRIR